MILAGSKLVDLLFGALLLADQPARGQAERAQPGDGGAAGSVDSCMRSRGTRHPSGVSHDAGADDVWKQLMCSRYGEQD